MATMCRVIMAKKPSRSAVRGFLLLSLGVALQMAMMAVPAKAQAAGGTAPSNSTSVKPQSSSQGGGPVVVPKDLSELRIEPGDLLSVSVYDAPEFTNLYRVDPVGNLKLPLCGNVNLLGATLPEATLRLEEALKGSQILLEPQVSIDVAQYAGQYVTGAPGRVMIIAPTALGDILSQAGGLTPLAGGRIKIRHGEGAAQSEEEVLYSRTQSTRETALTLVRPGDSVIVPRAGIVYVLGAVNRPGGYVMQEDGKLNVAQALALSGGTVLQANTGGLRVIRRNPDGTILDFPLSYNAIAKGTQAPLMLEAQDIVYVPMSKVKATFSTASSILSSAASAAIITH